MRTKYKEIFKLKNMLEKADIPFDWIQGWGYGDRPSPLTVLPELLVDDRYQICYPKNSFSEAGKRWISVVEGYGTYGSEQDLLEIMDGVTIEERLAGRKSESVQGWMTANNVFNRIKNNWEERENMKKTVRYVDEDTLEIKEVVIEEETASDEVLDTFAEQLREALGCEPDEFYDKYKKYKNAEAEFKNVYDQFKEKLIQLHSNQSGLPKSLVIGGTKITYVSPSTRTTIDTKKLKEEEPDLAKKYTKTTNVNATIRIEDV